MYKKSKILLILLLFCQSVYSQNKCPCEYGTTIKIKGKTSLIDSLGNYLIKSTDYIYIDFNESLAVVHFQSENKEFEKINSRLLEQETASKVIKVIPDVLSAVIDCNGRFVIRPTDKYFIRGNFNHGYAMIEQDEKREIKLLEEEIETFDLEKQMNEYYKDKELLELREITEIDNLRGIYYPDDVLLTLEFEDNEVSDTQIGSVSERLLRTCDVPVLLIK